MKQGNNSGSRPNQNEKNNKTKQRGKNGQNYRKGIQGKLHSSHNIQLTTKNHVGHEFVLLDTDRHSIRSSSSIDNHSRFMWLQTK
jgi:hypothetical protein